MNCFSLAVVRAFYYLNSIIKIYNCRATEQLYPHIHALSHIHSGHKVFRFISKRLGAVFRIVVSECVRQWLWMASAYSLFSQKCQKSQSHVCGVYAKRYLTFTCAAAEHFYLAAAIGFCFAQKVAERIYFNNSVFCLCNCSGTCASRVP